jgi:hypothetical protein
LMSTCGFLKFKKLWCMLGPMVFWEIWSFHEKFRTRKQCFHHIICLNGLRIGHMWVWNNIFKKTIVVDRCGVLAMGGMVFVTFLVFCVLITCW